MGYDAVICNNIDVYIKQDLAVVFIYFKHIE